MTTPVEWTDADGWPVDTPESHPAHALDRSFFILIDYYQQSKGKPAKALVKRLCDAFPEHGCRPRDLAPWTLYEKSQETQGRCAWRRHYWEIILRPMVTDLLFMTKLKNTTVRVKDMDYTTEDRDANILKLEESVAYWDKHFENVFY